MSDCSNAPELSVAVCTWNPAAVVEETLSSLRWQSLPRARYEVLIIDNASAPDAAARLANACATHEFRYVREDTLGLSHARNRALAEARGHYVYFIDDDAVAPAHLLATLLQCFQTSGADVVGGPAHGLWDETPPRWLRPWHWRLLSLVSYGAQTRNLGYPDILLGCNIAFRRALFDDASAFRHDLGRSGRALIGNEERELQRRLMAQGRSVVYEPRAYVFHRVTLSRMTRRYLLERMEAGAASNRLMDGAAEPRLQRAARFVYRQCLHVYHALCQAVDLYVFETRLQLAAARGSAAPADTAEPSQAAGPG